jgi:hypothetical protein
VKLGVLMFVSVGPLMVSVGAAVSIVQVRLASVRSRLPAASVARTRNVCWPSGSPGP